jgi:general secretion pathway protein D
VWNCWRSRIRAKDLPATHIMKSLITADTVFLVVLLVTPVADKGQSSYKQGRDLEARQNYEGAYASYERAYDADPRDTRYRAALTRIRFVAGASIVHRATLLQAGRLEKALTLLEEAVRIDSPRPIATQQVLNTRNMIQQARGNRAESASPSGPELSPDILDAQGPVKLNGVSNLPVTLKLSQDTKIVYRTIGQTGGR